MTARVYVWPARLRGLRHIAASHIAAACHHLLLVGPSTPTTDTKEPPNISASAMPPSIGPKLSFISAEETIVELEFPPDDSSDSYDLCYKVYQQTWEQQRVKAIGKDSLKDGNVQVAIEELEPGTTYCFRLVAKASDGSKGEPGPELIIDTEAVSCTPKRRRCVVM